MAYQRWLFCEHLERSFDSGRIQCQNINTRYTMVSQLINKETSTWNVDAINVDEPQRTAILSIPLGSSFMPEIKVWR